MKNFKKYRISIIMALSGFAVGFLVTSYIGTLKKRAVADFENRVQTSLQTVYAKIMEPYEHTSSPDNPNTYQSAFYDEDSSLVLITNQTVQNYPLTDWEGDTSLPARREKQFQEFAKALTETQSSMPALREFYIIRLIQYCDTCFGMIEINPGKVAMYDSILQQSFVENQIETEFVYGIYSEKNDWIHLSKPYSESRLKKSEFQVQLGEGLYLSVYFPQQNRAVIQEILEPVSFSMLLFFILMFTLIFLHILLKKQQKLAEHKSDFINNITHEFKTPIATIDFALANIENVKVISDPEKILEITEIIREENKRMNGQVEQLLRAAKTDKAMTLQKEVINLHELINHLADITEIKVNALNGKLNRKMNAAQAHVFGDEFHLSHAISNLLDNAQKYSQGAPEISIETRSDKQGVYISVKDQGIGISRDAQRKIFDRFYRV
ncbi:MAG: HAMP domain-containing histidine kinase, partial [Bacteroidetes bacterium]|nr:HAMP domain-containing histidine kinase [Bacteroidota bacterium]